MGKTAGPFLTQFTLGAIVETDGAALQKAKREGFSVEATSRRHRSQDKSKNLSGGVSGMFNMICFAVSKDSLWLPFLEGIKVKAERSSGDKGM